MHDTTNEISDHSRDDFAGALELFFGEANPAQCRVYARLRGDSTVDGCTLAGTITGPKCPYARTLSATFSFVDRGPGATRLAEAVVPDPCFWTPRMPYLYQVALELRHGGDIAARESRQFGMRPLAAAGRNLMFEHDRWVARGVSTSSIAAIDLKEMHDASAVLYAEQPADGFCEQASRFGVLVVARLIGEVPFIVGELRRLSRWPAVGIAVLDGEVLSAARTSGAAPNLLLGQYFAPGTPVRPVADAPLAFCELQESSGFGTLVQGCQLPVIALLPAGLQRSIREARALCDALQRDLAAQGDFAGYVV